VQPRYALIDYARNGSVEQISGANEQIPEGGQTYLSGIGSKVMLGPLPGSVMEQPLIAIVDDDESVRDATERLMRSAGFSAETFSRGADFLSSPDLSRTACLVTDLNMPGMSGIDLHRRLQSLGRSIPTVLITGQPNENVRTQALSLGIICYLPKPFRNDDLIDSIHSALRSRQASGAAVSPPASAAPAVFNKAP
jgi:FixJ family two-component response regulator